MAGPDVTDEFRDRSKIVGPTLIFDQHAWSPERLTRLRQLNLELAPPSSSQLPLKSAVSHQFWLIRRLNLAHPIVDARQYQWQITHRDGHGIVMGVGSHPAMLSMLGGELAFSYHAMVVLGLSARAWHAFDLGFVPSFVVNLTRRPVQRRAQSIPVNRQRHRPPANALWADFGPGSTFWMRRSANSNPHPMLQRFEAAWPCPIVAKVGKQENVIKERPGTREVGPNRYPVSSLASH
jgi:hypothetical protein